jgi:hypothetical protein
MPCCSSAKTKWSKSYNSPSGYNKVSPQKVSCWVGCLSKLITNRLLLLGEGYGLVIPSEDGLDVVVCDVSGHGIGSALVANRIYSETMAQIESGAELGSMLRHLNHFAVQNLASSSFFFTVAAMRLHRARGFLQFAGAGHPPAIIVARDSRHGCCNRRT